MTDHAVSGAAGSTEDAARGSSPGDSPSDESGVFSVWFGPPDPDFMSGRQRETLDALHTARDHIDETAAEMSRQWARRLCHPSFDVADLRQELLLAVEQNVPHYDPDAGTFEGFAKAVMERHAFLIRRRSRAAKRRAPAGLRLLSDEVLDADVRAAGCGP